MTKQARTIILTVIATLVAIVVLQNMRTVSVRFILWDAAAPLSLFFVLIFSCGLLAGLFWRRR